MVERGKGTKIHYSNKGDYSKSDKPSETVGAVTGDCREVGSRRTHSHDSFAFMNGGISNFSSVLQRRFVVTEDRAEAKDPCISKVLSLGIGRIA